MNTLGIALISLAVTSHWGLILIFLNDKTTMSFYKYVCFLDPCVRPYVNLHWINLVRYRCKWFWILILSFMYSGLFAALCCTQIQSANPLFLYLSYGQVSMVMRNNTPSRSWATCHLGQILSVNYKSLYYLSHTFPFNPLGYHRRSCLAGA